MTTNELKSRYTKYDKQIQEWMINIIEDLTEEVGAIPKSYIINLDLLAETCDILNKSKSEIDKHGLMIKDSRGGKVKNPSCAIWNAANLTISKLLSQLLMTRSSKTKFKSQVDSECPAILDEFI